MDLTLALRFLHICAAIAFIGGVLARQVVRAYAGRATDVHTFAALNHAAGRIETLMVIPGNFGVIAVGVALALRIDAPILGFLEGASQNWLLATIVLLTVGMLTVPFFFVPRGKRFDAALSEAVAQGDFTPRLREVMHDPALRAVHAVEIALLVAALYLMVFKPF